MTEINRCRNCDTPLAGKFCHVCGQKQIEDRERTFRNFIYQFFGSAFFLENNFIKNLWFLLTRPGFLPREYFDGRRKRYMAPISLFLLINLIYFFATFMTDINLSLKEQINQPQHKAIAKKMVDHRLVKRNISLEDYALQYNEQSTSLSKTLVILHVPVLAFFLWLLYLRKNFFFTDHMIFSLYLMGFFMLFTVMVENVLLLLVRLDWISGKTLFTSSGYINLIILPQYFFFSVKRFYRQKVGWTLLKTFLIMVVMGITHFIYRTMLFFTIFWTT